MKDAVKAIPPPETDIQYMILIIVIGIVVIILGWKFLELKYGKKKEEPKKESKETIPERSQHCKVQDHQLEELDRRFTSNADDTWEQLRSLRQDMNLQAVETEKAFGKLFSDMIDKMEDHLDRRDERMEKHVASGFKNMEKGMIAQMQITFRPMVESAVQEALKKGA